MPTRDRPGDRAAVQHRAWQKAQHTAQQTVEAICQAHGISRQAFYQRRKRHKKRREREAEALQIVRSERADHPRMGTRKLYQMHTERFRELNIGRDKLFDLLRREGLLVDPPRRTTRTTDSAHRFGVYDNLIEDVDPQAPGEVWVADLTYLDTAEGFCYASILMDAYSRKIVGWNLSDRLTLEGPLEALKEALSEAGAEAGGDAEADGDADGGIEGLIHHSDRGVQYCSTPYVSHLADHDVQISMAAVGDPYQNAKAERVIGTLKREYLLDGRFQSEQQARKALAEAVRLYNQERPHLALDYQTPAEVHGAAAEEHDAVLEESMSPAQAS